MAAGRATRRRPERSTAYQETPPSFAQILMQVSGEAAERWLEAARGTTREEASRAFAEISPIVAKHWSALLDRLWKASFEPPKEGDFLALQRELHLSSLYELNELTKEVMGTKAFAGMAGDSVESFLKAKIASDRMMEEVLKAMRIPTKADIDDIHSSIYNLTKKVDQLLAPRPSEGRPQARRGRRR